MNNFTLYLLVTYYSLLLISHLPFLPQRLSCQTLAKTSSLIPMEMWTINRRCLSCHMTPVYGKMTILVLSHPKDLSSKMSQVSCIMVYEYPEWWIPIIRPPKSRYLFFAIISLISNPSLTYMNQRLTLMNPSVPQFIPKSVLPCVNRT